MSVFNDKEKLQIAAASSSNMKQVIEKMGLSPHSGSANYRTLKKYAKEFGVDLPSGQGGLRERIPDKEFFSDREVHVSGQSIKKRLIRDYGWQNVCSECKQISEWNGKHLVLQLDHIDGNNTNNNMSNLRFLCPNCHTQTKTYCGRNNSQCPDCNVTISPRSNHCVKCAPRTRKSEHTNKGWETVIDWPTVDVVVSMVKTTNFSAAGRKLGVSDNAVRKFLSRNEVDWRSI